MPFHPIRITTRRTRNMLRFIIVAQCALALPPARADDKHPCMPQTEVTSYDAGIGTVSSDPYGFYVFDRTTAARAHQNPVCATVMQPDSPQADPQKADNMLAKENPSLAQQRSLARVE